MPKFTFSEEAIKKALRRANAEKRELHKKLGTRTKFRPLGFDFARAFLELLRSKYVPVPDDSDAFNTLMESLLWAMYCADRDTRHGYKQIAGWLFEPYSKLSRERSRIPGNVQRGRGSVRVRLRTEGKQTSWAF